MAKKAVKKKKAVITKKTAKVDGILAPQGVLRAICYVASVIAPVSGFIFGVIFFSQKADDSKTFGKVCFILMLCGILLVGLFFLVSLIVGVAAGTVAGTELNFGEGYY